MRGWLSVRTRYLQSIVASEAPPTEGRSCSNCEGDGSWRCLDCLGRPILCFRCCMHSHQLLPFHRVEQWRSNHFSPSWLSRSGVAIFLGHKGIECPQPGCSPTSATHPSSSHFRMDFTPEDPETLKWSELNENPPHAGSEDSNGHKVMTIVDRSGIHHIGVSFCTCPNAPPPDQQLLDMALYPATQENPQTAFTFQVLDDFLIENEECKVKAASYYAKLRRVSSNAFPFIFSVLLLYISSGIPSSLSVRIDTGSFSESPASGDT